MAPATALGLAFAGAAVLSRRGGLVPFQALALVAGLTGWIGLCRHLYGGEPLLLPLASAPQAEATPAAVLPAPARRLRILVVDDDPLLLRSLRDTLEDDGHLVVTANHGRQGIDTFLAARSRGERFSVVVTDLGMPHVDGRRVASAVKAAAPETPVVLPTGWGQRLVAEGDVPAGVDKVLAKPPRLHELRAALAACAVGAAEGEEP